MDVTNDLNSLVNLELPPRSDPPGRLVVKITVLLIAIMIVAAFTTVVIALFASLSREDSLQQEIGCVRQSAVLVDQRLAEGMSTLIDNDSTVLTALHSVAVNNSAQLEESLAEVQALRDQGEVAQINLVTAIEQRQQALVQC